MDNIHGKMIYSFEKPMWHAITEPSLVPMTAEEIIEQKFGGGFSVEIRPATFVLNGEPTEDGVFAIVRTASPYENTERKFNSCTSRFHPLQPLDVAHTFDISVNEYVETMGFFGHGEQMFISWKLPKIDVRVGDEVQLYGMVTVGWDTLKGANLLTAAVRTVCWNTHAMAQAWANRNTDGNGKGNIWKGKSTSKDLLRDLGYWMSHVQGQAIMNANMLENFFGKLAETPIKSDAEAKDLLLEAYPPVWNTSQYYPKELKESKNQKIQEENEHQEMLRDGIFQLFAGAGTAITPDYWGLYNSTTEYFCHVLPSKRPIAESVMVGGRQKLTNQLVQVLTEHVK